MAANASDIYEEHIRTLPAGERLRLLALIADELAEERGTRRSERHPTLLDLHGLGKESWAGVDAQDYVNRLRDEWSDTTP